MPEDDDPETHNPAAQGGDEMDEGEVDSNIEGTFPASDPPSWTLGTNHRRRAPAGEESGGSDGADVAGADDGPAPAR